MLTDHKGIPLTPVDRRENTMDKGTSFINTLKVLRLMRRCCKAMGRYNELDDLTKRIIKTKITMAHHYGAIPTGRPTGKLKYR